MKWNLVQFDKDLRQVREKLSFKFLVMEKVSLSRSLRAAPGWAFLSGFLVKWAGGYLTKKKFVLPSLCCSFWSFSSVFWENCDKSWIVSEPPFLPTIIIAFLLWVLKKDQTLCLDYFVHRFEVIFREILFYFIFDISYECKLRIQSFIKIGPL